MEPRHPDALGEMEDEGGQASALLTLDLVAPMDVIFSMVNLCGDIDYGYLHG